MWLILHPKVLNYNGISDGEGDEGLRDTSLGIVDGSKGKTQGSGKMEMESWRIRVAEGAACLCRQTMPLSWIAVDALLVA